MNEIYGVQSVILRVQTFFYIVEVQSGKVAFFS